MSATVSKNAFYHFIFTLCVAVPYLNNYELTFAVWFLAIGISLRKSYSKYLIYQVFLFGAILFLAFLSSFFNDYKSYDFIRDITYLIKPILGLLVGYQLCRNYLLNPFKSVIYAGVFLGILHLIIVFYYFFIHGVRDIHGLRFEAGYFSDFEVYALVAVLFHKELGVELSRKMKIQFIVVLAVSSMFYLARINFIQFAVLFMAMKGYFVVNRRMVIVLSSIVVSCVVFYAAILYVNPRRNGKGFEAFLYKVKIAPIEPFKTTFVKGDWKDFNDNYRSVENILTVRQMTSDKAGMVIFGKGLGSRVDLNQIVLLDGVEMQYISILHNGYMTVFLKSGIIGVLILILSIFLLLKAKNSHPEFRYYNYMLVGSVLFLWLSYWVFMGFYFKADTKSILIGLLLAAFEKKRLEIKQNLEVS